MLLALSVVSAARGAGEADVNNGTVPVALTLRSRAADSRDFTLAIAPPGGPTATMTSSLAAADLSRFQVLDRDAGGATNDEILDRLSFTSVPEPSTVVVAVGALLVSVLVWPRFRRAS